MPTNFQYRLQQFESAPPAESWQHILLRLNEELGEGDIIISKKLSDSVQAPPANLWSAINEGLSQPGISNDILDLPGQFGWPSAEAGVNKTSVPESSVKEHSFNEFPIKKPDTAPLEIVPGNRRGSGASGLYSINWSRLAFAAAFVGIALSALYYFISQDKTVQQLSKINDTKSKTRASPLPGTIPGNNETVATSPGTNMAMTGGITFFRKRSKTTVTAQQVPDEPEISNADSTNTDISYANISNTEPAESDKNIAISTRPIRDNQGNIIMDEKLISAPDVNYVTVTSPNGEQTKISKKFLHALAYLNAGTEDDQIGIALQESSMWKWLFEEWRQKLLKQPSFIPSTMNFLDIMELKEVLNENF